MIAAGSSLYYLCLVCPDPAASAVRAYQEWMLSHHGCKAALKSPPHITLVPPFRWPEEHASMLKQVLSGFRFSLPSLEIHCNQFGHFGERVLYIRIAENPALSRLASSLGAYLEEKTEGRVTAPLRAFTPHITIATRDMSAPVFRAAWAHFSSREFSASFAIRHFSLMRWDAGQWLIAERFAFQKMPA